MNAKEENKNIQVTRYQMLINLWAHHNTMQFQWPAVIITAALLIISTVIPSRFSNISNFQSWGHDLALIITVGVPLLLTGVGMIALLYTMGRGQKIMSETEREIVKIEKELDKNYIDFSYLNHPKGFSGARLLRFYMTLCLAIPITLFGAMFIWGVTIGVIVCATISTIWFFLNLAPTLSQK
jgi:hypothetical protein